MPTPIPIRPETAVVQSGTSMTFASRGIRPAEEMPRPARAIAERQAGGHHRSERDQQHDRGAEEADALRARLRLRLLDRVAAQLDLESVAVIRLGGVDQLRALVLGHVPAGNGQRQGRRAVLPVLREADRRVARDVVDLLSLGEERVHALLGRRAVDASGGLPDDVDLLAGVPAEALLGDVARRLRIRAGRVVVGVELALEGRAHADDHDHRDDPSDHHAPAAAIGDVCETG